MFITIKNDLNYPNNSVSDFICVLDEPLEFREAHSCAVVECYFINDLTKDCGKLILTTIDNKLLQNDAITSYYEQYKKFTREDEKVLVNQKQSNFITLIKEQIQVILNEPIPLSKPYQFAIIDSALKVIEAVIIESYEFMSDISSNQTFEEFHKMMSSYIQDLEQHLVNTRFNTNIVLIKGKIISLYNIPTQKAKVIKLETTFNNSKPLLEQLFLKYSNLFYINHNKSRLQLRDSTEINKLDYQGTTFSLANKHTLINNNANLATAIYIYTDLVEDSKLYDTSAPLLKIIKPRGTLNELESHCFERPQFIKLRTRYINRIRISLRDQYNEPVNFKSGYFVLKLEFKRLRK